MRYLSLMVCMASCSLLFACAQNTAFQAAKADYLKQEYAHSLAKLQPAAQAGDAKSQYALGYMYFYGQGTTRDVSKAKHWIRLAARQDYLPARRALNLITQNEAAYSP